MNIEGKEEKVIVISTETTKRLLKDIKHIIKNPLTSEGIYYIHDEANILKGYAMIVGPSDTPYFGGYYFFEFNFPTNYPYSPPSVKYCTNGENIRFNPNLYTNGKVCVSILNTWEGDKWSACQTINSILLTLCSLLNKEPLLNEPGIKSNNQYLGVYNKIIEYSNINIAICGMLNRTYLMPVFEPFYTFMVEHFVKNYDKLLEFVCNQESKNYGMGGIYGLNVYANYTSLHKKLLDCYNNIIVKPVENMSIK